MRKIFLCHASEDKDFVRRLKCSLFEYGIYTWLDEDEIQVGDSLREKIEIALQNSKFAIIVFSNSSVKKPWVQREVNTLFSLEIEKGRKVILPAIIDDLVLPAFFKDRKYADFSKSFSSLMSAEFSTA